MGNGAVLYTEDRKRKELNFMKMFLKIFAIPVLMLMKIFCLVGNIATKVFAFAVSILLLIVCGSVIYCVVQAKWQELMMLAVMGVASFLILFIAMFVVFQAESWSEQLGEFIKS